MSTNDPIDRKPAKGRGAAKKADKDAKANEPEAPNKRDDVDLFIDEVTEELQKERAYAAFRRYGPFVGAAIVLIVIGAAVNEYLKSAATESARAAGSAFLELVETDVEPNAAAQALADAASEMDAPGAVLFRFQQATRLQEAGDMETARAVYRTVAATEDLTPLYRDLAAIRGAMVAFETEDPSVLIKELALASEGGRPYRPLALELTALAEIRDERIEDARRTLGLLIEAEESPGFLRERATQLLEAIGGAAPSATGPAGEAAEAVEAIDAPPGGAPE